MMTTTSPNRALQILLATLALSLSACTSILGDFKYDAKARGGSGSGGSGGADAEQGDIVVSPTKGLVTTEQGAKATFTIVLKRAPLDTVAIALSSSNEAEGLVSPSSVTFTPTNFGAPQTVSVVGVDDPLVDGNQPYSIRTSPASSSDASYAFIDAVDPSLSNVDDETAGFTLMPTLGLLTTESGGEATFTIVLNSPPISDVTFGLSSDNVLEGTVSPAALSFTPLNWNAPQIVTAAGVNDDAADGAQIYHTVTAAAASADPGYDKLDPEDAEITNQDNDTAGLSLFPALGLFTSEIGQMATFGIALNSPPTADVVIGLSSSDLNEGSVFPASVTFTPLNWMAPQTVTASGVDDQAADGNQLYSVLTAAADSDDVGYSGLDGVDALITNIDDDSPGITVTPTEGLMTEETGTAATFSVVLNSMPSGDVLLDVSSSAPQEGSVSPAAVAFTETNWNAPQVVTITGVNDQVADGNQPYVVRVTPNPASSDPSYAALPEIDVSSLNIDDDSAGINVTGQNLTTGEQGMSATFSIALNSRPTADVKIDLTSNNTNEGTVSPSSVTFTPDNYNAPRTITVKGVDDRVADGSQPYRVVTHEAISADAGYSGMNARNVEVINTDDDSPGITVSPTMGLVTGEGGATATFSIVLNSQPTGPVAIALSSTNTAEGTVSPGSLSFTAVNWNAPQVVTIRGQDDQVADGPQQYRITIATPTSPDPNYNDKPDPPDLTISNTDNDSAGITVLAGANLTTTEAGASATFQVVLNSKPTASVSLGVSSSRTAEATVSPATLNFTTANWNAPQTVTATGVDDKVADGNQSFRIITNAATSQDAKYQGIDVADVNMTNTDNDSAGITVAPVSGLTTTEAGGSATFTVVLTSQPVADVTVPLRSSRSGEGTISPVSLTFTPTNYNSPRTVTVTGVNDNVADGAQPYSVVVDPATSPDGKYAGIDASDVAISNVDNDSAGFTVSLASGDTTEAGGTATFTVVLNSEPRGEVAIPISSSDPTEGTVSLTSISFTPLNWSAPRQVTVTGAPDSVADGPQPYTILLGVTTSTDAAYKGQDPNDVALTNVDDDSAGITVSAAAGSTTEAGGTTTFSIVLNSQPTSGVTVPVSSSNTSEGTIGQTSVVFTTTDWASPKLVTVTGVNDDVADGEQPYSIITGAATSTDVGYKGINPPDVELSNVDNDSAGITVSAAAGSTSEGGGSTTFTVVLNSKPTAGVSIPILSSDDTEGTLSQASVVFTTINWSSAQTITITGVNDDVADGPQPYSIITGAATSTDLGYKSLNPIDVLLSNVDNDSAGITVSAALGSTSEAGTSTTFTIVLNSKPLANVAIPISSSDETEGTPNQASVSFTTNNWSSAQTITVSGENDNVADGTQPYSILTGTATSTDPGYSGLDANNVAILNVDNDSAGVTVSLAEGNTSEAGGTTTFSLVLNSQPTASVSIAISSSNTAEGTLTQVSVPFTTSNWAAPQTITVHGENDAIADGDQEYKIITANPTSADAAYAAINPADVTIKNVDNDSAGITVGDAISTTSEGGASTTFSIVLNSQPTASVTIPLTVNDSTEGQLPVASVTFTSGNWSTPKSVTVVGVDDSLADGPQDFKVLTGAATSTDAGYSDRNAADVIVTNLDNDSAGIVVIQPVSPVTGEAVGAANATFSVVLTSAPSAPVTIGLTSTRPSEGIVISPAAASLVFDATNWNDPQVVTVKGVQDVTVDGAQPYTIQVEAAVSTDVGYSGRDGMDVALTNTDDD